MEIIASLHLAEPQGRREAGGGGGHGAGSNTFRAALIAEWSDPMQGLLVHGYWAILRGAKVPELRHEAIIWLMPKGTAARDLDAHRPIALGQQDMRLLVTPFMRRFTAVLGRKGVVADW